MREVAPVLSSHRTLLHQFSTFLPEGYRIEKLPRSLQGYYRCHENPESVTQEHTDQLSAAFVSRLVDRFGDRPKKLNEMYAALSAMERDLQSLPPDGTEEEPVLALTKVRVLESLLVLLCSTDVSHQLCALPGGTPLDRTLLDQTSIPTCRCMTACGRSFYLTPIFGVNSCNMCQTLAWISNTCTCFCRRKVGRNLSARRRAHLSCRPVTSMLIYALGDRFTAESRLDACNCTSRSEVWRCTYPFLVLSIHHIACEKRVMRHGNKSRLLSALVLSSMLGQHNQNFFVTAILRYFCR